MYCYKVYPVYFSVFFLRRTQVELDRENDAIADAIFQQFPGQVKRLQELERRYNRLPNRPNLPSALVKLHESLEKCTRSRQVEHTVIAVKKNLDALRDGLQELGISLTDLTDSAVDAVTKAVNIRDNQVVQLKQIERWTEITEAIAALEEQLNSDRSWRDISSLEPHLQAIEQHYKALRLNLIESQEKQAKAIQGRLKQRQNFIKLNEKQGEYVFRSVQEATYDTTQDALYPSLLELKDSALIKLQKAETTANNRLDDVLSEVTEDQVVQLPLNLSGREVSTEEEVDALVNQLRDRLLAQLKPNTRIRLS